MLHFENRRLQYSALMKELLIVIYYFVGENLALLDSKAKSVTNIIITRSFSLTHSTHKYILPENIFGCG